MRRTNRTPLVVLTLAASTAVASCGVTEALTSRDFTLTVTQSGDGTITSSPGGVSTNANGGSSSSDYSENTSVTLTATPATGWELSSWGGDCSGAAATCQLTMSANRSASATFTPVAANQFSLSVTKTGMGTVTSSPAGISIGSGGASGDASFVENTAVTLTATPASGWRIAAWSGACTGNAATCMVTMDANQSVSLILEEIPTGTALSTGVPVTGLAGAAGSSQVFRLAVPAGVSSVRFVIEGGTGDADLRVRFGSEPTFTEFDCRPGALDNEESCNHGNPAEGDWFVQVSGFAAFADVTLTGTYQLDPSGYSIQIEFDPSTAGWTAAEVAAVTQGIRTWEVLISQDLDGSWSSGGCGFAVDTYVDDFLIYVTEGPIDGASNTLAQAGFCSRRRVNDGLFAGGRFYTGYQNTLPYYGVMTFDEDDVSSSLASGLLDDVAAHEMGHALGIGVLWDDPEFDLIQGDDSAPFHVGSAAVAAFNTAGGVGSQIPIEPVVKGHWDENAFGDELMTPLIMSTDSNPVSAITLGTFEDMGYSVDYGRADPYTYVPAPALVAGASERGGVYMMNDILRFEPAARSTPRDLRRH